MEWIKVSVGVAPAHIEPLTGLLLSCGIGGVEVIDPRDYGAFLDKNGAAWDAWDYADESLAKMRDSNEAAVVFYLAGDAEGENALAEIKTRLSAWQKSNDISAFHFRTERVDDATWLNEWKKYFVPIRVGRVAIVPAWETTPLSPPAEITFTLDPGSAFGTGQHATTYLCVEALQEKLMPGDTLLDIGCGSGILSIIGLLLGAEYALACDIDPSAVSVARKNAALNPIDMSHLDIMHGDIFTDEALQTETKKRPYNIITANIVADAIIGLAARVPALLASGGFFIASGIIDDRAGDVLAAFTDPSLQLTANREKDGWHCIVWQKAGAPCA